MGRGFRERTGHRWLNIRRRECVDTSRTNLPVTESVRSYKTQGFSKEGGKRRENNTERPFMSTPSSEVVDARTISEGQMSTSNNDGHAQYGNK